MISISKPKIVCLSLVSVMLLVPSILTVQGAAVNYNFSLPNNAIFFDDFEAPVIHGSQGTLGSPAGGSIALNTTTVWDGAQSLRIRSGTVSGGGYEDSRDFGWSNSTGVNMQLCAQVRFSFPAGNRVIEMGVERRNGPVNGLLRSGLSYNRGTTSLIAYSKTGSTTLSSTLTLGYMADAGVPQATSVWHFMRVCTDFNLGIYLSAQIDDLTFTTSQLPTLAQEATAGLDRTNRAYLFVTNGGGVTTSGDYNFDNWLVTVPNLPPSNLAFSAAQELWKTVAVMGSMMSVVTMYSSVRAYQEPDPLRRRMKLMVAVVFAVGAGTLAVFAIILSRL